MSAPVGNQFAKNAKIYQQALKRALARRLGSVDAGLDKLADTVVALALDKKEEWAIVDVINRIDGKPAQAVTVSGDEDAPLTIKGMIDLVRPG